jgi:hypothetical protein
VILILILAITIIALAAFMVLPELMDHMVDAYDDWKAVFDRIKRRTNR